MKELLDIWNFIVHSNTFNFIVMVLLLVWIVKKFNIKNALEVMKNNIIDSIEKSKQEKESASKTLNEAKDAVKNLDSEINARITQAEEQGKNLAKQILTETDKKVKQIENNIERVVEAEEKTISSKLTSKTVKASVELSKNHIINLLKTNPKLHEKFINESIEEIDRIKI